VTRKDEADSKISCDFLTATGPLFGKDGVANTLAYSANISVYDDIAPGIYVVTIEGTAGEGDGI
jgi:hypothetical protein